ncbi:GNAT family N-acetyltransferase [Nocardia sp. NPDC005366]|uniref:GNAT family N-acetyltransferase n=1 Tax=Nocardia sp. NPDC005366 TaxID=3156878 RepID=UPI0033BF69FE
MATKEDIPRLVSVLDRAFEVDDPFGEYMFPDEAKRRRHQPRLTRAMIRHQYLPSGCALVASAGGQIVGGALWQTPAYRFGPLRYLASIPEFVWAMGSGGPRALAMDATIAGLAKGLPHFFGVTLGVDPDHQHSGVGRALLAYGIAELERAGAPMLALCKDGNVAYYQAGGAQRIGRIRLGRRGPEVNVVMWLPSSLARIAE